MPQRDHKGIPFFGGPTHQAWLPLAVRAQLQARGWLLLGPKEEQGVPGSREGQRLVETPMAAGTRLGERGGGPGVVGSRLFLLTLPQGSLYITRAA